MDKRLSIDQQTALLPIFKNRDEIIASVQNNLLTIISGDTGCGKTTQVPKYIFQANVHGKKMVAVTQPRRISAISVSERVAVEMQTPIGQVVGYEIRFENQLSDNTRIKFLTEGILLKEFSSDNLLKNYSVVIIDEAHERGINCDLILGLARQLLRKRRDVHIVVMSATLETEKIVRFFTQDAKHISHKVISVQGRFFPIEIYNLKAAAENYLQATLDAVLQIHFTEPAGDVLVFLTGQVSSSGRDRRS